MARKKRLGAIPLVDKFRARRAIKRAEREIERLKGRVDVTKEKIEAAKRRAEKTDRASIINQSRELETKLSRTICPARSGSGTAKSGKSRGECAEELFGTNRPGRRGWTPEQEAAIEACAEGS